MFIYRDCLLYLAFKLRMGKMLILAFVFRSPEAVTLVGADLTKPLAVKLEFERHIFRLVHNGIIEISWGHLIIVICKTKNMFLIY